MYPYEIDDFIKSRGYKLYGDDIERVTSVIDNPQINYVEYNPYENKFHVSDIYGNHYQFEVIPFIRDDDIKTLSKHLWCCGFIGSIR